MTTLGWRGPCPPPSAGQGWRTCELPVALRTTSTCQRACARCLRPNCPVHAPVGWPLDMLACLPSCASGFPFFSGTCTARESTDASTSNGAVPPLLTPSGKCESVNLRQPLTRTVVSAQQDTWLCCRLVLGGWWYSDRHACRVLAPEAATRSPKLPARPIAAIPMPSKSPSSSSGCRHASRGTCPTL